MISFRDLVVDKNIIAKCRLSDNWEPLKIWLSERLESDLELKPYASGFFNKCRVRLLNDNVIEFGFYQHNNNSTSKILGLTLDSLLANSDVDKYNDLEVFRTRSGLPNTLIVFKNKKLCGIYCFLCYVSHFISNNFIVVETKEGSHNYTYKINFKDFSVEESEQIDYTRCF